MNREIKFRAWDKENHKMVEYGKGDYREWCVRTDGKFGYISKDGYLNTESYNCDLMQYTGLHDKNGKEIYEGDIVQVEGAIPAEVYWEYCSWQLRNEDQKGGLLACWDSDQIEVIGNIYENPELLKGPK